MTKLDHHRQRQQTARRTLVSEARYGETTSDERRIRQLEQERLSDIARSHRHEHRFCGSLAGQLDRGRLLTSAQAAKLFEIAAENGWTSGTVETATLKNERRQNALEERIALYEGDNVELRGYAERSLLGERLSRRECGRASYLEKREATASHVH